jgi:predicted GIY-YIG superfamily endonuclease
MASQYRAEQVRDDAPGTIYLIHFSLRTKAGHQHYLGWSANVEKRFARHRAGHGAEETRKAVAEGLKLILAQTWTGTLLQERRIKEERRQAALY